MRQYIICVAFNILTLKRKVCNNIRTLKVKFKRKRNSLKLVSFFYRIYLL